MDEKLTKLAEQIGAGLGGDVTASTIALGELTIQCEVTAIHRVLRFLREDANCQFLQVMDICGADYPQRAKRFDVVYHLLSLHKNHRVRIKVAVDEQTPVPSASDIWPAANWFE